MRTAAKVFIWIGMIFGFYLIFPLVVGIIALKKLSQNTNLQELHNFGIVTLFFCSFLGGLFMMLVDDEKCKETDNKLSTENTQIIQYEKITQTKEELRTQTSKGTITLSRFCIWSISISTILCFIADIIMLCLDYYFEPLITVFTLGANIIALIISLVFFLSNRQYVDLRCNISLLVCLSLQSALLICSALAFLLGSTFIALIIFCLNIINMILTIVTISINRKVFKNKRKVVTSKLEIELNEAKRLLDSNIISNEEYEKMRNGIISKYC